MWIGKWGRARFLGDLNAGAVSFVIGVANIVSSLETGGQASGDDKKIRPFGFKHTLKRKHSIHGH